MAKKPTITTVASGYQSTTTINNNFSNLINAFDNTLSRDGSTPNAMLADLDLNSNDILNAKSIRTETLFVNNVSVDSQQYDNLNTAVAAAEASANIASGRADDIAALAGYRDFADYTTLVANATLTYTAGQPTTVLPNEVIRTRKEGFSYRVAAAAATDHHITTAGGIKLYVQPIKGEYVVDAFGAVGDGVADDASALTKSITAALASSSGCVRFSALRYRVNSTIAVTMPNPASPWVTSSTSSNTIGTGTKTFTVGAGLAITPGDPVTASAGTLTNLYMTGTVTSYSGTTLVINVTSVAGSGTYTGWDIVRNFKNTSAVASLTMVGAGQDATTIYFPNTDGFNFAFSSQQHAVHISKLSITTGALTSAKAVIFTNSYPYFGTFVAQSDFTDVTFRGDTGYSRGNSAWNTCVQIANVSDINFTNVNFIGSGIPTGNGLVISSPGAGSFNAPVTTATVFNVVNCNFTFLGQAINYGANTQTLQVANSFFAQNTTDIYVPPSAGSLQGLTIDGCTFFKGAPGDSVYITSPIPNLIITDNFFCVHSGYRAIAMDEGNNTTIVGNQFLPNDTPNGATAAIYIGKTDAGSLTLVDSNTFSSTTIGCSIGTNGTGVYFGAGNVCTSNMTLVSQSALATGNTIYNGLRSNSANKGIGYGSGSGGTVTQLTDKTTGVTINSVTGRITTANSLLNAGTSATFTVTNSNVQSADVIVINVGNGNYAGKVFDVLNGSFKISLQNTSVSNLSDAVAIGFAIIKGSIS